MLQVSVYRYNPEKDAAPFMQDFQIDTNGKDIMVLDVLALIKEQDEGFSYRRSCRGKFYCLHPQRRRRRRRRVRWTRHHSPRRRKGLRRLSR